MKKLSIVAKLGKVDVVDEVDLDILARMTPYSRRKAFGALMEHIYIALVKWEKLNEEV